MMSSDACPFTSSYIVADYLAGRLDSSRAEAFERHAFECEHCREALEAAALARAAFAADDAATPRPAVRLGRAKPLWLGLALAASLLFLAVLGIWRRAAPPPATFRGVEEESITVVRRGPELAVDWPEIGGTDVYRVRLFSGIGDLLVENEVSTPPLALRLDDLEPLPEVLWVEVTALDPLREPLWRSPLRPVSRQ